MLAEIVNEAFSVLNTLYIASISPYAFSEAANKSSKLSSAVGIEL